MSNSSSNRPEDLDPLLEPLDFFERQAVLLTPPNNLGGYEYTDVEIAALLKSTPAEVVSIRNHARAKMKKQLISVEQLHEMSKQEDGLERDVD